jgi:hypothetical protein
MFLRKNISVTGAIAVRAAVAIALTALRKRLTPSDYYIVSKIY